MLLPEHYGKSLLARAGIPVPRGRVASSGGEAFAVATELGCPVAVKAQVLAGGRGKAGGVRFAYRPSQAADLAGAMLQRTLLGQRVERVLVEERLTASRELYLGLLVDAAQACYHLLLSAEGGVDVEQVARERPDRLRHHWIDPLEGLTVPAAESVADSIGLRGALATELAGFILALYRLLVEQDLMLAEINPLMLTRGEKLVAADARLEVDDDALYRHPDLRDFRQSLLEDWERKAQEIGVSYVPLEGDVGVIASGAGLGMATVDLLGLVGLRAANFLDTGGGINADLMRRAVELVLSPAHVRGGLVNLYGGINPMVEAANGIVAALRALPQPKPLVVKLVGNCQEEAWAILEAEGVPVVKTVHTEEAARLLAEKLA